MSKHPEKLKEFRSFTNNDDDNMAAIEITNIEEEKITVNIGEMFDFDFHFSSTLIKVTCDEEGMEELIENTNSYIKDNDETGLKNILEVFTDLWLQEMEDDDDEEEEEEEGDEKDKIEYFGDEYSSPMDSALVEKDPFMNVVAKKKELSEREKLDNFRSQFNLKGANPVAVKRLLKDYYELSKAKHLGFHAYPKGKDLFDWEVRLTKFDIKTDEIAKDFVRYKKEHGIDYILLSMKFPEEYPFKPPFIRVIRPRITYLTGHVTIGGSICMQILTSSGWVPSVSVENIIVQILLAITQGGAKIDFNQTSDYTEFDAKEAFFRVARRYKWEK